jgi:hypothetical protein
LNFKGLNINIYNNFQYRSKNIIIFKPLINHYAQMKSDSKAQFIIIFSILCILLTVNYSYSQKIKKSRKKKDTTEQTEEDKKLINEITYYNIITPFAKTDSGLFLVHYVSDKFYFEIPQSLFNKDMLLVSRIAQIPQGLGGDYINAGTKIHEQIIRWEKKYNKVLLRTKSYLHVADESLPINISVESNNYEPIIYAFDIETYSPDSSNVVIGVNSFYASDIHAISGLTSDMRKDYKVNKLDKDRSFIESISSFPRNIEVRHELTYAATEPPSNNNTGTLSILMNQSMILLPENTMMPRFHDERIGWLTVSQIDYGSMALKADTRRMIKRWKLEPTDVSAYRRGELVEPVKPIVYFLDPATPEIWRPYIKAGVELWQQVFETAGFKNAIIAKDPPSVEDDPDFSPEDIRYSVIRYVATTTRNAMGPSVVDPRSGEIIESDIMWYHNHLRSYRNRYMIETGAANPSARTLNTPQKDMGEMLKMVIAHEVGHALGLPHNMKASSAYPVDSLRSGSFTQEHGIAASIMDYARFNYVAQPGDENIRFIRNMGPYDHYAINWGYRWIPDIENPEEEKQTLDYWIKQHVDDPVYMFGSGKGGFDPSAQTENVGNDPIEASSYGIRNLKIVSGNLIEWTSEDGNDYSDLKELYGDLVRTWGMYCRHVLSNIGGVYQFLKSTDQEGLVYMNVKKDVQSNSLQFLNDQIFETPDWLLNDEILQRIEPSGEIKRIYDMQTSQLNRLLQNARITRMLEAESKLGTNAYTYMEMMDDLRNGIWTELYNGKSIDIYRRNLQVSWINKMSELLYVRNKDKVNEWDMADIASIALFQLNAIKRSISAKITHVRDTLTKTHLTYCLKRIEDILALETR